MSGYLEKGIQASMARSRSTKSKWIRTSRLSIKNSFAITCEGAEARLVLERVNKRLTNPYH